MTHKSDWKLQAMTKTTEYVVLHFFLCCLTFYRYHSENFGICVICRKFLLFSSLRFVAIVLLQKCTKIAEKSQNWDILKLFGASGNTFCRKYKQNSQLYEN